MKSTAARKTINRLNRYGMPVLCMFAGLMVVVKMIESKSFMEIIHQVHNQPHLLSDISLNLGALLFVGAVMPYVLIKLLITVFSGREVLK